MSNYTENTPLAIKNIGEILGKLSSFHYPDFITALSVYKGVERGLYTATAYIIEYNFIKYYEDLDDVMSGNGSEELNKLFIEDKPALEIKLKIKNATIYQSSYITLDSYYSDGDKFLKELLTRYLQTLAELAHGMSVKSAEIKKTTII